MSVKLSVILRGDCSFDFFCALCTSFTERKKYDVRAWKLVYKIYKTLKFIRFNGTNSVQFGFFVTMIDGVEADSTQNQYWEILGGADMAPLPLGVSSYVPADKEKVLFRLVTWSSDDAHADTGMFILCF